MSDKPQYAMDRILIDLRGVHGGCLQLMNKTKVFVDEDRAPSELLADMSKLENKFANLLTLAEDWRGMAGLNGVDVKDSPP